MNHVPALGSKADMGCCIANVRFDPKRTCLRFIYFGLSYHRSLCEGGQNAGPEIVEEHKNDRHNPAVHGARDKPIDEASNGQQCKVWEDRRQQVVPFKTRIDQP